MTTEFFFELTPDRVLEAVEASGFRCTGRCAVLNSFENRVYEVELDEDSVNEQGGRLDRFARRKVVKFYRPGRWSQEQILEEHQFLEDLKAAEIPAVAPERFPDGKTLHQARESGIWYAVFPKVGGRAPDELSDEQALRLGRLLARVHSVGVTRPAPHRILLDPTTYGRNNLEALLKGNWIPAELRARYQMAVEKICDLADPWFQQCFAKQAPHRIHGDCHFGNLLWSEAGPFFLDFDDMLRGPAVQDIWLLIRGRDEEALRQRELLLAGYEEMRHFDRTQLRLVEVLRALRIVHYSAWVARRWDDPAFPAAFPEFGSYRYWAEETESLVEQLRLVMSETTLDHL